MIQVDGPLRTRFAAVRRGLVICALIPLIAGACATKRDFRDLSAQLAAQEQARQATMAELRRLIEQVAADQSQEMVDNRGEILRQLISIQDQLIQVQELSGQNSRTLTALRDEVESRRADLSSPVTPPRGTATGGQAEADFEAARSAYERESFTAARRGFQQFVATYAGHPLAAEAHYLLADILYRDESSDAALAELTHIPERYPTSERVPEALYRMGTIEIERGDADAARLHLERIVNTYPDSDVATLARQRLAEIG